MRRWIIIGGTIVIISIVAWLLAVSPEAPIPRTSTGYGVVNLEQFTITTTGSAGTASGSKQSDGPLRGHVYGLYLDYAAGITTTTDLTITTTSAPIATLMTRANSAMDGWFYPAAQQTGSTGSGTGTYDRFPVADFLTAALGQSTAGAALTITVYYGP